MGDECKIIAADVALSEDDREETARAHSVVVVAALCDIGEVRSYLDSLYKWMKMASFDRAKQ